MEVIQHFIGENRLGVKEYITHQYLRDIYEYPKNYKDKFTNQQWAKIRKLIKKEFSSARPTKQTDI